MRHCSGKELGKVPIILDELFPVIQSIDKLKGKHRDFESCPGFDKGLIASRVLYACIMLIYLISSQDQRTVEYTM